MSKLNQEGEGTAVVVATLAVLALIVFGIIALVNHNNRWNKERGRGDADVGEVDNHARKVYQMPDRFGNVAMFCDEYGNAVYTTTSDPNRSLHSLKDGCE